MFYVPYVKETDPWYNLGQILGLTLGKTYDNYNRRQALKENQGQEADYLAYKQGEQNDSFQNLYNDYSNAKDTLLNEGNTLATAYNNAQTPENLKALREYVKKVDPNIKDDEWAMTNALNAVKSGSAAPLQGKRQLAQDYARGMNPNVDFTSGDWGTSTYQRGLDSENYYKNYRDANKGKKLNGAGDEKYMMVSDYIRNNPYAATSQGPLQRPSSQNTSSQPTFTLGTAQPLNNFDPLGLTTFRKKWGM